jgi:hypothetical protein
MQLAGDQRPPSWTELNWPLETKLMSWQRCSGSILGQRPMNDLQVTWRQDGRLPAALSFRRQDLVDQSILRWFERIDEPDALQFKAILQ